MDRYFKRAASSDFESAPGSAEKIKPKRGRPPHRKPDENDEAAEAEALSQQYAELTHKLNQAGRSKLQRKWAERLSTENAALWQKLSEMEMKLKVRDEAIGTVSSCSTRAPSVIKPETFSDSECEVGSLSVDVPEHVAVGGQATALSSSASGSQPAMRQKRRRNDEDLAAFRARVGREVSDLTQSENAEIGRQASKRARFVSDAAGRAVDQTVNRIEGATSGRTWGEQNPELLAKCREDGRNLSDDIKAKCREAGRLGGRPRKTVEEGSVSMSARLSAKMNPQRSETKAATVVYYLEHVQRLIQRGSYENDEDIRLWKQLRDDFPKNPLRVLKRWWKDKAKWFEKFKGMETGKLGGDRKNGARRGSLRGSTRKVRAAGGGRQTKLTPLLDKLKLWFEKMRSAGGYVDRSVMFDQFTQLKTEWQRKFNLEHAQGLASLQDILMHKALLQRDEAHERSDKNVEYSKNFMQKYLKALMLKPQRFLSLTVAEERARAETSWKLWDLSLWLVAFGTEEELFSFVVDPLRIIRNRKAMIVCERLFSFKVVFPQRGIHGFPEGSLWKSPG